GPDEAQQHADRRRLARAVGTEETVHATGRHVQVQTFDADAPAAAPAVGLAQADGVDRELAHRGSREGGEEDGNLPAWVEGSGSATARGAVQGRVRGITDGSAAPPGGSLEPRR